MADFGVGKNTDVVMSIRHLSSVVEQQFCKLWVVGSIPTGGSKHFLQSI